MICCALGVVAMMDVIVGSKTRGDGGGGLTLCVMIKIVPNFFNTLYTKQSNASYVGISDSNVCITLLTKQ